MMLNRLSLGLAVLLIALGGLWSLQGAGVLHIKPILCVGECREVQTTSLQWVVIGLGTIIAGAGLWYLARRRSRKVRLRSREARKQE